jgi:hypothetical protein
MPDEKKRLFLFEALELHKGLNEALGELHTLVRRPGYFGSQ